LDLTLIAVFLVIGCVVGFIAGLLGIGGGMTMIPRLMLIFSYEQFPADDILHIAVATSMATIVFTSIANVRAHNQPRGAVARFLEARAGNPDRLTRRPADRQRDVDATALGRVRRVYLVYGNTLAAQQDAEGEP
jgi:hypothetical protein